jgi:hypothetical protein
MVIDDADRPEDRGVMSDSPGTGYGSEIGRVVALLRAPSVL